MRMAHAIKGAQVEKYNLSFHYPWSLTLEYGLERSTVLSFVYYILLQVIVFS